MEKVAYDGHVDPNAEDENIQAKMTKVRVMTTEMIKITHTKLDSNPDNWCIFKTEMTLIWKMSQTKEKKALPIYFMLKQKMIYRVTGAQLHIRILNINKHQTTSQYQNIKTRLT